MLIASTAAVFDMLSDSEDTEAGEIPSMDTAMAALEEGIEGEEDEEQEGDEEEEREGDEGEGGEREGEGERVAEGDEVSRMDAEDTVSRGAGGKPKKLTNQFNFCERAALTYNNPTRVHRHHHYHHFVILFVLTVTRDPNYSTANGNIQCKRTAMDHL